MQAQIETVPLRRGKEGSNSAESFKGKLRENLVAVWVRGREEGEERAGRV